jgi:4,5-dihydroxyphthalate decarboxylase
MLRLSTLVARYDRTADLLDGRTRAAGVDLEVREESNDTIRQSLGLTGAFDVWEAYLGRYLLDLAAGGRDFVAIPVIMKRAFRHSSIYVRRGGPIHAPSDLPGRRVGVQRWTTTAGIWAKGILAHDFQVDLATITWVSTVQEDGPFSNPSWLRHEAEPGADLLELLVGGKVDAAITSEAWSPHEVPAIDFLFPDFGELERAYYARTRIFPSMHVLLVRRVVLDQDPWVGPALFDAFTAAKQAALDRLRQDRQRSTMMWFRALWEEERAAVGTGDPYPWGVRATLGEIAQLQEFAVEQGILDRPHPITVLFHRSTLAT